MSNNQNDFFSELFKTINKGVETVTQGVNTVLTNTGVGSIGGNSGGIGTKTPAINIIESGEAFEVRVAAPGMSKELFKLAIKNNALVISSDGEPATNEAAGIKYHQREFEYGAFERPFAVPETADINLIAAAYKDGMLVVTLPKKAGFKTTPEQDIKIW